MEEETLIQLGLTKNESKVYLALLSLGSTTVTKIADVSKVHRVNVYDSIEKLKSRGLVSYIYNDDKKYFEAANPENLMNIIKEKEAKLQTILPRLLLNKQLSQQKSRAHILEGVQGIKATCDDILIDKQHVFAFGIPKEAPQRMKSFLQIYHTRRIAQKQWQLQIYDEASEERIQYLHTLAYTRAAIMPEIKGESPATTTVYGNKVAFYIWADRPLSIIIEEERMAKMYFQYFKLLWRMAYGEEAEETMGKNSGPLVKNN